MALARAMHAIDGRARARARVHGVRHRMRIRIIPRASIVGDEGRKKMLGAETARLPIASVVGDALRALEVRLTTSVDDRGSFGDECAKAILTRMRRLSGREFRD